MSSRPVYWMCAQVAPFAKYLRGHGRVAVDVTALRRLWQHSPVLVLVMLACVPLCAVLRGSLLCNSSGLSAVKINKELLIIIIIIMSLKCVVVWVTLSAYAETGNIRTKGWTKVAVSQTQQSALVTCSLHLSSSSTSSFVSAADIRNRRSSPSTLVDSPTLLVPSTPLSTLGDRAFPVAAARAWNSLPPQTRAACSILTFRRETSSIFSVSHLADRNLASFPADS